MERDAVWQEICHGCWPCSDAPSLLSFCVGVCDLPYLDADPDQPALWEIIATRTGTCWRLGEKPITHTSTSLFQHAGFYINIPHMSIDPLSDRCDLAAQTLKSFVPEMSKPSSFIDWSPAPTVQVDTNNNDSFFNKKPSHAETVGKVKRKIHWRHSMEGYFWLILWKKVAGFHLQTGQNEFKWNFPSNTFGFVQQDIF